jgi:aminoglycoside phosphotransferase (APT) family kinase protein
VSNATLEIDSIEKDRRIPTLPGVLDSIELRKHLRPVLPAAWGTICDVSVQVLEHHPGQRCTLDMSLQTTTGRYGLIGKVYADDRSDIYRAMKHICQSGFGPEAEFSIPEPVTYLPAIRLLLQEKVQGPLAKEIFLKGDDRSRTRAAEACAQWLARYHAIDFRVERVFALNDQIVLWERWSRKIAALGSCMADKAYQLFKQLESAAPVPDDAEPCAGHGSYSHRQIILAHGRTVTFDWDGYCMASPSRDVARFIIGLRRLALGRLSSIRGLDSTAEIFRQTYIALVGPRFTVQLPVYEAAICLELAVRNLRKCRQLKAEALIDEALRILE